MKAIQFTLLSIIFLFFFVLSSCVSNKKHQEILENLKTNYQTELDTQSNQYKQQLSEARGSIKNLELSLAERKGENNVLMGLRKELEGQVDSLTEAIENLSSQSQSNRQNLNQEIRERDQEVSRLLGLIQQIDQILLDYSNMVNTVADDIRPILSAYPQSEADIITSVDKARVILSESLVFRGTSATRLDKRGIEILEIISNIMQRYPSLVIEVTGHTDNRAPANKGYKDNWNYSALRAATVARLLIQDFNMLPNQVTVVGKGEYSPLVSNETSEGRKQNRRIELIITPLTSDIAKSIKKISEQKEGE